MTPLLRRVRASRLWLAAVGAFGSLQILLGLAGLVAAAAGIERPRLTPSEIPDGFRLIAVASFSSLAAYLLLGGRRDRRVSLLGTLFLVQGVFYASPAIESLALALPRGPASAVRLLGAIRVDAFTPAIVWSFFRDFPRALEWPRTRRVVSSIVWFCSFAALALIAANLALALGASGPALARFDRANPASRYWTVVFGLLVPAPFFILWRVRRAPEEERRRVRLFASGLAVGAVPPIVAGLLPTFFQGIEDWARRGLTGVRAMQALVLVSIVSVAGITAYAVVVQRVLDVGAILRKAAQYAAARVVTGLLAALPFGAVVVLLYQRRDEPIAALFAGARPLLMLGLVAAGLAVLRVRRAVMVVIDRLLFRESHDARRTLAEVARRSRATHSIDELASSLSVEIDRALHLESLALLVLDTERDAFVPVTGAARVLARSSALLAVVSRHGAPLVVTLDRRGSPLQELPDEDRQWLADGAVELIVPLVGSADSILGLLTLGPKRSELPFSREDLLLLSAIGAAAGIGLENRLLRDSARPRARDEIEESAALECARCGWVGAPGPAGCPECSGSLSRAHLPQALLGKFRLERRIGAGAMGVVYRATDLALGRAVALKTLPVTTPEDSVRLRREARAMAAITHPNLALIFGAETWQGTPVLVMEYLAGGTLADRLATGPLAPAAAIRISLRLASVLERAHDSGLLHRDVKPSNVGFTHEDVPKLLDFGLARIAGESAAAAAARALDASGTALSRSGAAGTLLYMSPEALLGAPPDPTFDLWSLGVVTFEALAGRHPFERRTLAETLEAIRQGHTLELPDPLFRGALRELFATLLARERGRRPTTARRLAQLLEETDRALARI
jgi:hypothetical protein